MSHPEQLISNFSKSRGTLASQTQAGEEIGGIQRFYECFANYAPSLSSPLG